MGMGPIGHVGCSAAGDLLGFITDTASDAELQGEGGEEAGPDERLVQRRALLQHLGLPTSHYLKPLPGTASVPLRPLLNASAVCLMPDHLAYHWWSAPAALKPKRKPGTDEGAGRRVGAGVGVGVWVGVQPATTGPAGTGAEGRSVAAGPLQRPDRSVSDQTDFPGQVEVKGVLAANGIPPQLAAASGLHAAEHTQWLDMTSEQTTLSGKSPDKDPPAFLPQQEPDPQPGAADPRGRLGDPFSCCPTHVQLEVLASLRKLLQSKLNAVAGGSAHEDEWLAHQPDCTPAARMALLFRVNQKGIAAAALHSLADVATEVVCGAGHATSSSESLHKPRSGSAELPAEEQRAVQVRSQPLLGGAVHRSM